MFQWYKSSSECWVYLADVSGHGEELDAALEQSRWFTRGWTLQELLAPHHVQLFSDTWNHIGDLKNMTLAYKVSKITGVPEQFLWRSATADRRLLATSISMRMSWAARRQTSIAEDMAYCLIGLFDVKMPLLYGEGGERAFTRLQEEIMKTSTDQTIFVWGYGMPLKAEQAGLPFHRLLAPCPKYFAHGAKLEKYSFSRRSDFNHWKFTNRGLLIPLPFIPQRSVDKSDEFYPVSLTQYIALLECQEIRYPNPFRKEKHRIGLHVEIQSLDDIDADGNLKHDIVISKLQTSRPFLVPEEVFDRPADPISTCGDTTFKRASIGTA